MPSKMMSYARQLKPLCRGRQTIWEAAFFQKRLNQNRDRAIILARGGNHWFYTFLYAKQDMTNITINELAGFRELAKHYARLTDDNITALIKSKERVEVCDDYKK